MNAGRREEALQKLESTFLLQSQRAFWGQSDAAKEPSAPGEGTREGLSKQGQWEPE